MAESAKTQGQIPEMACAARDRVNQKSSARSEIIVETKPGKFVSSVRSYIENEQRRSKNCGWRNMPPRRGSAGGWCVGYKDAAPDGARKSLILWARTKFQLTTG